MDTEEYRAGYRNGRLDRIIRAEPLVIALTRLGSYGQGYLDGYNSLLEFREGNQDQKEGDQNANRFW